jgi:cathepsin C
MFLLLVSLAAADLPVHCLRHQVAGQWTFFMSEASPTRGKCGHTTPDSKDAQPTVDMNTYPNQLEVRLDQPSSAMAGSDTGSWTMVYDEGFEVTVGMKNFFAFNMFDGSEEADGEVRHYKSDCTKTQVGWYRDGQQFGCFVAQRKAGLSLARSEDEPSVYTPWEPSLLQEHVYSLEEHAKKVAQINSKQSGWKAAVYPHLLNKTHAQLNRMAGIRRGTPQRHTVHPSFLQRTARVRIENMPTDFDWHNKDGKNYVPSVVNQGSCGSCYAISAMTMLTARKRIMEDDPASEPFSTQVPLYCGEYTQGCDGGYPELVAKWGHDVALLPESCGRYDTADGVCRVSCDSSQVQYKVQDYGYVGGFYGGSKEANIMEEIYSRGPVAIAIEPKDDFMYYNSGVYEHSGVEFDEWTRVDHAVTMTGWGEEDGKKYWRVQNSWGPEWGEGGSFRIRRGVDESAVEAQVVFATLEKSHDGAGLAAYTA